MDRENSEVKMEMPTRGAEMSEHYECPNCNYRITAECKCLAHPNQPCPNCEELWFRDFKEVTEPSESLSPLGEAVRKARGGDAPVKIRRF